MCVLASSTLFQCSRAGEACGQELPNHCTAWLVAGDLILSLPLPLDNVLS